MRKWKKERSRKVKRMVWALLVLDWRVGWVEGVD